MAHPFDRTVEAPAALPRDAPGGDRPWPGGRGWEDPVELTLQGLEALLKVRHGLGISPGPVEATTRVFIAAC